MNLVLAAAAVAPVVKAHLERHFYGGGAVVGIETAAESRRRQLDQTFRQRDHWFVAEAGQQYMLEIFQLILERGIDARVAVAE